MLIGHLPASYLWTRAFERRHGHRGALWLGLLAGVAPDFDLLYFYLVDQQQHLHHTYWTHVPFSWLLVGAAVVCLHRVLPSRRLANLATVVLSNIALHLLLDTLGGGIAWLYPASARLWCLVEVPAREGFWVWSFVLHWTFLLELLLVGVAWLAHWRWHLSSTASLAAGPPAPSLRSSEELSIFSARKAGTPLSPRR